MKKILTYISVLLAVCSCSWYDDSKIWEELREHEERIEKLEALCGRLNSNVEALQGIMEALEANDYVTDITKIMEDGVEVGYSITFAKGGTITVYHGVDGADASAPKIGIRKASDGEYYWTADDEWLTDEDGEMIPASVAEDPNGKYITPLFRVAEGVWYISYDGGDTWKVAPTGGSEGIFKDVTYDNDYLYMTLEDGTIVTLPRHKESSEPTTEEKLSFLNFIQSCEIADKMVHFSCDDTYACLYDLILNAEVYESAFENSFFASLKRCHEETGACFTLMTFNSYSQVPGYDISNLPSKFQAEFQESKSWLRFAFHAENETTRYATATGALESYNRFVSAIHTLTGDYECIDRITRLGYFSGSLENVMLMKNAEHGIIGLLTADDTRTSYYLTHEESETARLKGKYYDLDNEVIFIKTLNRSWSKAKEEMESNPLYRKMTEFFWHEYEDPSSARPWITTAANLCNEMGYIHGFPTDLYRPVI